MAQDMASDSTKPPEGASTSSTHSSADAPKAFGRFLVGGAVRDELLGRPVNDRDWVVVGATQAEMLAQGYVQVGRDFPVFLHPDTKEEHALARTERKQGSGHTGFVVHASPDVTLEEDLIRRDLTINAIAQDERGGLVDPFGGVRDIEQRRLRHVSEAFAEDPLRILRVARFASQLPDFVVAPETNALMSEMCRDDALAELSAERIWQEFVKALTAPAPQRFFAVLAACEGLTPWFDEILGRDLEPWPATSPTAKALGRFVYLPLSEAEIEHLSARLKVPKHFLETWRRHQRFRDVFANWQGQDAEELLGFFEQLKSFHDLQILGELLSLIEGADLAGLWGFAQALTTKEISVDVDPGPEYGRALHAARLEAISELLGAR